MIRTIAFGLCLLCSQASAQHLTATTFTPRCLVNTNAAEEASRRWPADANVTVYVLRNDFAATELVSITRAIDHWNTALFEINLDVRFSFGAERDNLQSVENSITIKRGSTYANHRHLAEIYPIFKSPQHLHSALIVVDQGVTDCDALTSVLIHEFGHSLGLDDCPTCHRGTTIMALYRGRNRGNDTEGPTTCDKSVVARRYGK